jgi:outer membrane autotransporter protein
VLGFIHGGDARGGGIITASGNTVNISGGTIGDIVTGGYADGSSANKTASGNTVNISGGTIGSSVYGGYAQNGVANGNSVNISGGKIAGVFGGGASTATGNTVTVSGNPNLATGVLFGAQGFGGGDRFTGNTLNVKTSNLKVRQLANFEKLNFYLPAALAANQAVLIVEQTANLTDGYSSAQGSRSSVVSVGIDGASSPLKAGDRVLLIDARTLVTNADLNAAAKGLGTQGVTLGYGFRILADANQLLAIVTKAGASEQAKSLSEGFLSGAAFLNQGADFVANKGLAAAAQAVKAGLGRGTFAAISGGKSRYKTGSHADVDGYSLMAGLSWGKALSAGRVTLGGFFEYGNGNYDTYNSFATAAKVRGKGDLKQYGAGILGRFDAAASKTGNWYAEASARAGKIDNDYSSADLRDSQGRKAKYSAESAYASAHLGAGYVWKLTEQSALDLYGKAFWTRQEGDSVRLSTGEEVKFEDADSARVRLGGRFSYAVNDRLTHYAGLAWEHEFDGKAKAKTNGYDIDAPKLKGDTGAAELGLVLKPGAASPLSLELGVQGYAGRREGVTGSVRVKYEF